LPPLAVAISGLFSRKRDQLAAPIGQPGCEN